MRFRRHSVVVMLAVIMTGVAACGDARGDSGRAASGSAESGVLEIAAGTCSSTPASGSWFRMVQPGGSPDRGPYVDNGDSPCADKGMTPLAPGADGGLRVGAYQPQPDPPFDGRGASGSQAVIKPVTFFAVPFGISSNP